MIQNVCVRARATFVCNSHPNFDGFKRDFLVFTYYCRTMYELNACLSVCLSVWAAESLIRFESIDSVKANPYYWFRHQCNPPLQIDVMHITEQMPYKEV